MNLYDYCGRISCLSPQLVGIVRFGFASRYDLMVLLNPTSGRDASHMCLISLWPKTRVYHYYTYNVGEFLVSTPN